MSRRQLGILSSQLGKFYARTCKSGEALNERVLSRILYLDTIETPVAQLAACKWLCAGTVILPEDGDKVTEAVKVAKINHVDPLSFRSPMEIVNRYGKVKKTTTFLDPATVPTLHFRCRNEKGVEVYDVDESEESRKNMRRIIDSHFGRNANPWCLLQGDGDGNLTDDSARCWIWYSAYPKMVAFQKGRLLAFSAGSRGSRVWWDRNDRPSESTRLEVLSVPGDQLGRKATYEVDDFFGKHCLKGDIFRGSHENGLLEKYRSLEEERPYYSAYYLGGRRLTAQWPEMDRRLETQIGGMSQLEKGILRLPESVKVLKAVPLFKNEWLKELFLPDNLECIEKGALNNNAGIRLIHMPSSLSAIPNGLFQCCRSLESVSLPADLKMIPSYTFSGCNSLRDVEIPKGVVTIGERAFSSCRSLTSVRLPARLKEIRDGAFLDCGSLKSIVIPDSVTYIGSRAFEGCSNLREVVLPRRMKQIPDNLFRDCSSLLRVVLPSGVEIINSGAFQGCSALEYVTFPARLKEIRTDAFQGCRSLHELDIPSGTEFIANGAFSGCYSLKEILIPQSVEFVDPGAFSMCPGIVLFLVSPRLYARFHDRYGRRVEKVA